MIEFGWKWRFFRHHQDEEQPRRREREGASDEERHELERKEAIQKRRIEALEEIANVIRREDVQSKGD